jgi:ABC-type bacteriocin/lantibiotic exporter with double-glycine peptidase domain
MHVIELMRLEKRDIFIIVLLTLGSGLLAFATPLAVQSLVNVVTMGGVAQPLIVVTVILFILLSLSGALYILEYYVV